jgi:tetratricopeptide (TPR) repeat protein
MQQLLDTQEKAVEMLVQNKDLPVILSNLGMAYGGLGEYQEAITMLQQAAILKPAARGATEAYQKYLHLESRGPYAGQVQAALQVKRSRG